MAVLIETPGHSPRGISIVSEVGQFLETVLERSLLTDFLASHPDDGDDPFDGIFFWHDPMVDGDGGGAVVAACRFFNVH